jgi:hypothetical protein
MSKDAAGSGSPGGTGLSGSRESFLEFLGLLEGTFSVTLPVPNLDWSSVRGVKEFCGGLLETSSGHLWEPSLVGLSDSDRLAVAGSLFLFRKVLPSSDVDVESYLTKMSSPADPVDPEFVRFCASAIDREFPLGWDRDYGRKVMMTSPTTSSGIGCKKSEGGVRGAVVRGDCLSREDFLEVCSGHRSVPIRELREVGIAMTDGKQRIVTSAPPEFVTVSPVHRLLYDFMSRKDWLLRGEARAAVFGGFRWVEDEVFVSGDYESATDNLSLEMAEFILAAVFRRCTHIPVGVRESCLSSLRAVLSWKGTLCRQERGQLMGNYLSFPLLCLQNFFSFRFLTKTHPQLPVKINGDDIVFRSPRGVAERWMDGVRSTGLTLSRGKTMLSTKFFSLNSTFFQATPKRVKIIPIVRATAFFKKIDCPQSIKGRFDTVKFFSGSRRRILREALLRRFHRDIASTQRSITRGLCIRVSDSELKRTGLWLRECFYLSLPIEPILPPIITDWMQNCVPPGFHRVPARGGQVDDPDFFREMVKLTWAQPGKRRNKASTDEYWSEVRDMTFDCRAWLRERKFGMRRRARLLKMSIHQTRKYLAESLPPRKHGMMPKLVWIRTVPEP